MQKFRGVYIKLDMFHDFVDMREFHRCAKNGTRLVLPTLICHCGDVGNHDELIYYKLYVIVRVQFCCKLEINRPFMLIPYKSDRMRSCPSKAAAKFQASAASSLRWIPRWASPFLHMQNDRWFCRHLVKACRQSLTGILHSCVVCLLVPHETPL